MQVLTRSLVRPPPLILTAAIRQRWLGNICGCTSYVTVRVASHADAMRVLLVRTGALLCRFDFCHVALQPPLRQQHGQFEIRGGGRTHGRNVTALDTGAVYRVYPMVSVPPTPETALVRERTSCSLAQSRSLYRRLQHTPFDAAVLQ